MKSRSFIFLFFFTSISFFLRSQTCSGCNIMISQNDTANYIVNPGQTLCIDSSGNCLGTITLNGGVICNRGFFQPRDLFLNSGTLNNFGNLTYRKPLSIIGSVNVTIEASSVINIDGGFIINATGSITNSGYLNVSGNIQNNGTLNNLNVINCLQINGNAVVNSGIINQN